VYEKIRAEEISGSQMSWSTPGVTFVHPGEIGRLLGCTFLYDGRYQIHSVSYTYGGGGFETQFEGVAPGQSPGATSIFTDLAKRVEDEQAKRRSTIDATRGGPTPSLDPDNPSNQGLSTISPDEGLA
jgi:hypothetical protein